MELLAKDIQEIIETKAPTLVISLAEMCKYCQELKSFLPEIKKYAEVNGINLYSIRVDNPENTEFLTKNQFETLPYCLVFVDGEFKGGDNVNREVLYQLIPAVKEAVERGV